MGWLTIAEEDGWDWLRCPNCNRIQFRHKDCVVCGMKLPLRLTKLAPASTAATPECQSATNGTEEDWAILEALVDNHKKGAKLPPAFLMLRDKRLRTCANAQVIENIGAAIRRWREAKKITQNDLQKLSRVSRSYLSRIESGQMTPSLGTMEKIAGALEINIRKLFEPLLDRSLLLEDSFVLAVRIFLPKDAKRRKEFFASELDPKNKYSILGRLALISS